MSSETAAMIPPYVAAVAEAMSSSVTAWSMVVTFTDGRTYTMVADGQRPAVTARQFADGLHDLTCSGCHRCKG